MSCKIAGAYNNIFNEWNEFRKNSPVNNCVIEFTRLLLPKCRILDVGCGTRQPIAQFLGNSGFRVTGIDVSEKNGATC